MRSSKQRLLAQLAFVFAVICVCVSTSSAKDNDKGVTALKAVIAFTETIVAAGACPLVGSLSGVGQASHLGKVSLVVAQDCIVPESATSFRFTALQPVVLQAANGDQLFGTYDGHLEVDPLSGIGTINGTLLVTGGTGRFANATGHATIVGVEAINFDPRIGRGTGQGIIQLDGTLSN